jgi:plasmid maintenance system killer protein
MFGGDTVLGRSLLARINALKQAETIKDIIVQPAYHFHKLQNKNGRNLDGFFAIDVKSRKEQWRIILQPLDEEKKPYIPCNIDEIAGIVKIVGIEEVSKHYE